MEIRGERECTECGTRWSYYETGTIACPECGALESVGTGERKRHTDSQITLDLTPVRADIDAVDTETLAATARDHCREYVRTRGFISGGKLQAPDETYLAASELRQVGDSLVRARVIDTHDERYFLALLRGADEGIRPDPEDVPRSLWNARGLASALAVRAYRRDVKTWSADRALSEPERALLESLGDHATRIRMLDGDIPPTSADALVEAARTLASGLRGSTDQLDDTREHLERLEYRETE